MWFNESGYRISLKESQRIQEACQSRQEVSYMLFCLGFRKFLKENELCRGEPSGHFLESTDLKFFHYERCLIVDLHETMQANRNKSPKANGWLENIFLCIPARKLQ